MVMAPARRYLAAGVEEVWLVDREGRTIEIRTPARTTALGPGETIRSGIGGGFVLGVDALFAT
jgi:Uma2 family endonuclease